VDRLSNRNSAAKHCGSPISVRIDGGAAQAGVKRAQKG
jgi:hypothetical protein